MSTTPTPESVQQAIDLAEWHFAATAPGAAPLERPEILQEAIDRIRDEHQGITGRMAVESTKPEIPADVRVLLDEQYRKHPVDKQVDSELDKRHYSPVYARGRGAF